MHIRVWPDGAVCALQDCFKHTDWEMPLREKNIEEYAETATSYIAKFAEDVIWSRPSTHATTRTG